METEAPAVSYTPNHIPVWTRVFYGLASPGLILYGAFGLWIDDLYIPGKRGPGTHLHGPAAWLMAAAMLMGSHRTWLGRRSTTSTSATTKRTTVDSRKSLPGRAMGSLGFQSCGLP